LAVLLNAQQHIAALPPSSSSNNTGRIPAQLNGGTAVADAIFALTGGDVSVQPSSTAVRKTPGGKVADSGVTVSAATGLKVRHLCGALDCQKSMFPAK
jgi:hypothetical protein